MRFKCTVLEEEERRTSASASWVDGLWLTSDESRTECVETWSSDDNGRQLVPGYYCAW